MAKKNNPLKYFNDIKETQIKKFQIGGPNLMWDTLPAHVPMTLKEKRQEKKDAERREKAQRRAVRKGRKNTDSRHGDVRIFD